MLTMLVLFRLNLLSLLAAIEARLRLGSWVMLLVTVTGGTSAIVCCLSTRLAFEALLLIIAFGCSYLACEFSFKSRLAEAWRSMIKFFDLRFSTPLIECLAC